MKRGRKNTCQRAGKGKGAERHQSTGGLEPRKTKPVVDSKRQLTSQQLDRKEDVQLLSPSKIPKMSPLSQLKSMTPGEASSLLATRQEVAKKPVPVPVFCDPPNCNTPTNKPNATKFPRLTRTSGQTFYNFKTSKRTEAETWWNQSNAPQKAFVETDIIPTDEANNDNKTKCQKNDNKTIKKSYECQNKHNYLGDGNSATCSYDW